MIDTAILLAAGEGSRLRALAPSKPLCPVAGRPLIDHALLGLAQAGIARAIVVVGYAADAIAAHVAARDWPLAVEFATTDHAKPNGTSVLAAEAALGGGEALLAMCDHLVEPALYARVAGAGPGEGLTLGIDRRLDAAGIDLDDVTRVATRGTRITAVGKGLEPYDCFDTGVFAIGPALFAALHGFAAPSLTDGVRVLAGQGAARVVDCSDLAWMDVDDAPALAAAERLFGVVSH